MLTASPTVRQVALENTPSRIRPAARNATSAAAAPGRSSVMPVDRRCAECDVSVPLRSNSRSRPPNGGARGRRPYEGAELRAGRAGRAGGTAVSGFWRRSSSPCGGSSLRSPRGRGCSMKRARASAASQKRSKSGAMPSAASATFASSRRAVCAWTAAGLAPVRRPTVLHARCEVAVVAHCAAAAAAPSPPERAARAARARAYCGVQHERQRVGAGPARRPPTNSTCVRESAAGGVHNDRDPARSAPWLGATARRAAAAAVLPRGRTHPPSRPPPPPRAPPPRRAARPCLSRTAAPTTSSKAARRAGAAARAAAAAAAGGAMAAAAADALPAGHKVVASGLKVNGGALRVASSWAAPPPRPPTDWPWRVRRPAGAVWRTAAARRALRRGASRTACFSAGRRGARLGV